MLPGDRGPSPSDRGPSPSDGGSYPGDREQFLDDRGQFDDSEFINHQANNVIFTVEENDSDIEIVSLKSYNENNTPMPDRASDDEWDSHQYAVVADENTESDQLVWDERHRVIQEQTRGLIRPVRDMPIDMPIDMQIDMHLLSPDHERVVVGGDSKTPMPDRESDYEWEPRGDEDDTEGTTGHMDQGEPPDHGSMV